MQVESTQLYKVRAIAESLDVSLATIYRAVESGALRAIRLGTGKGAVRISAAAVQDYLAACERAAATASKSPKVAVDRYCVICNVDLQNSSIARYPVGRSVGGVQVFACETHRELGVSSTAGGAA